MRTVKLSSDQAITIFKETLQQGDSLQFTVQGTSMEPTLIHNKTIVTIKPYISPLRKYDIVLVEQDNRLILHRIIKLSPLQTRGDNLYKIEKIENNHIIGVVSKYEHNGKTYHVHTVYNHIHFRIIRFSKKLLRYIKKVVKHG